MYIDFYYVKFCKVVYFQLFLVHFLWFVSVSGNCSQDLIYQTVIFVVLCFSFTPCIYVVVVCLFICCDHSLYGLSCFGKWNNLSFPIPVQTWHGPFFGMEYGDVDLVWRGVLSTGVWCNFSVCKYFSWFYDLLRFICILTWYVVIWCFYILNRGFLNAESENVGKVEFCKIFLHLDLKSAAG